MKTLLSKVLATGGVCALCAFAGTGAFAQGFGDPYYHSGPRMFHMRRAQQDIAMLQAAYAHDVAVGDYAAAARDHRKAQMLRDRIRDRRGDFEGGYGMRDHGY